MNGITETEEYQEKPDFTQFQSSTQYQGSLKPPKRTMSAYAFYSRKVYVILINAKSIVFKL